MSDIKSGTALEDLVKFMVYLAFLGLVATLVIYFIAVAPGQHVAAPMNLVN
jgi:hypothetical protein